MASFDQSASHPWSAGKCLVLFSAPWCGHCKDFKNTWDNFSKSVKAKYSNVRTMMIQSDKYDTRTVTPEVFGYPTIRAYNNGQLVKEFEDRRTPDALHQFVTTYLVKQKNKTMSRKTQRGGGGAATGRCDNAIGKSFDVPSQVPPGEQWTSPYEAAPSPPYNGGLYTGAPFSGPHGSIPVTPTAANYIHNNLRSASGTPGTTTQYPTAATSRPGNNFSAMPGVSHFAKQGTGPHNILCTGDVDPMAKGSVASGGKRRRRVRKTTRSNVRKYKIRKSRGGLNLRSANMDDGAPFHPQWALPTGGKRRRNQIKTRRRRVTSRSSRSRHRRGGLNLRSANMDDGAPFHPEWSSVTNVMSGGKRSGRSRR